MKFLPFLIAGVFLYMFLFPLGLESELSFQPRWVQNYPQVGVSTIDETIESYPFHIGELFGYVGLEGDFSYLDKVLYDITLSKTGFINYSSVSENLVVQYPDGVMDIHIKSRGFPILSGERLFLIATNHSALSEWSLEGEPVWERKFGSLLTSFDASENHIIVGLLDGRALLIDSTGDVIHEYRFSNNRVEVTYGVAVDSEGKHFAVLGGLDPQQLVLHELRNGGYEVVVDRDLLDEFRRSVFLKFSHNDRYLFFESSEGLRVQDSSRSREMIVPAPGEVEGVITIASGLYCVLSVDGGNYHLGYFEEPGIELGSSSANGIEPTLIEIGRETNTRESGFLIFGTSEFMIRADTIRH